MTVGWRRDNKKLGGERQRSCYRAAWGEFYTLPLKRNSNVNTEHFHKLQKALKTFEIFLCFVVNYFENCQVFQLIFFV
jgi:hypothetical protein